MDVKQTGVITLSDIVHKSDRKGQHPPAAIPSQAATARGATAADRNAVRKTIGEMQPARKTPVARSGQNGQGGGTTTGAPSSSSQSQGPRKSAPNVRTMRTSRTESSNPGDVREGRETASPGEYENDDDDNENDDENENEEDDEEIEDGRETSTNSKSDRTAVRAPAGDVVDGNSRTTERIAKSTRGRDSLSKDKKNLVQSDLRLICKNVDVYTTFVKPMEEREREQEAETNSNGRGGGGGKGKAKPKSKASAKSKSTANGGGGGDSNSSKSAFDVRKFQMCKPLKGASTAEIKASSPENFYPAIKQDGTAIYVYRIEIPSKEPTYKMVDFQYLRPFFTGYYALFKEKDRPADNSFTYHDLDKGAVDFVYWTDSFVKKRQEESLKRGAKTAANRSIKKADSNGATTTTKTTTKNAAATTKKAPAGAATRGTKSAGKGAGGRNRTRDDERRDRNEDEREEIDLEDEDAEEASSGKAATSAPRINRRSVNLVDDNGDGDDDDDGNDNDNDYDNANSSFKKTPPSSKKGPRTISKTTGVGKGRGAFDPRNAASVLEIGRVERPQESRLVDGDNDNDDDDVEQEDDDERERKSRSVRERRSGPGGRTESIRTDGRRPSGKRKREEDESDRRRDASRARRSSVEDRTSHGRVEEDEEDEDYVEGSDSFADDIVTKNTHAHRSSAKHSNASKRGGPANADRGKSVARSFRSPSLSASLGDADGFVEESNDGNDNDNDNDNDNNDGDALEETSMTLKDWADHYTFEEPGILEGYETPYGTFRFDFASMREVFTRKEIERTFYAAKNGLLKSTDPYYSAFQTMIIISRVLVEFWEPLDSENGANDPKSIDAMCGSLRRSIEASEDSEIVEAVQKAQRRTGTATEEKRSSARTNVRG